jgi:hypothetical protein
MTGALINTTSPASSNNEGVIAIGGALGFSDTQILASNVSNVNSYNQIVLQNLSTGTGASSSYVVGNGNTGSGTYYGEFGQNGSGYATGSGSFNLANAVYVGAANSDLSIGTYNTNAIHFAVNNSSTDAMTISGSGVTTIANLAPNTALTAPLEGVYVTATAPTSTQAVYVTTNSTYVLNTASAANNWAFNVASTSGATLNSLLATGQAVTITYLVTQGSTAYYCTGISIDGTSQTVNWQGGTAPSAGNASGIDAYTITIIKTAGSTYTVLAALTKF